MTSDLKIKMYKLLLANIDTTNNFSGLCAQVNYLSNQDYYTDHYWKELTDDMREWLKHPENPCPRQKFIQGYWWEFGDRDIRKEFLRSRIQYLKKETVYSKIINYITILIPKLR